MSDAARTLLREWLGRQLDDAQSTWLDGQISLLQKDLSDPALHTALGLAPRRLGKDALALSDADLACANAALDGWDPRDWSVADAARILLLSGLPATGQPFADRFRSLCQTADVTESIALHRGLPLYPDPTAIEPQVGEGLRTNMRAMFEAIAHRNPYPRLYFDTHRWNHMVLKALFIDSQLAPIQGLDERANPELARIMCDFAHERWAAGRTVPFEIWRCVGPYAEGSMLDDLARALASDDSLERRAAALALSACLHPGAASLLHEQPALAKEIAGGTLSWATLS